MKLFLVSRARAAITVACNIVQHAVAARGALTLGIAACLGGCTAALPQFVDAGKLGRVSLTPSRAGAQQEGAGPEWWGWLFDVSQNAYYRPGAVPASLAYGKHRARQALSRLMASRDGLLWIGHSTFLVRYAGVTILTDPVFSDRASPFQWSGPRRYLPPGLAIEDLPSIDVVLVSHNHYDHLDVLSLAAIAKRSPGAKIIVPAGNESHAVDAGFRNVLSTQPGSEVALRGVKLTALPAYHVGSRFGFDAGRTPCLSWSLTAAASPRLFVGGDTAYGPLYKRIRRVLGPHQVALVPIGAHEPPHEVGHVHATPEEAARIAQDLGAGVAVAMHWGTFPLSPEHPMEPKARFRKAAGSMGRVMHIGEALILTRRPPRIATAH
jgi:L-ascorbate metabolism protein UlaG (beta-lactamase superfamily)